MQKKLKVLPLGGVGEIGKNMTVLEYGEDLIVVDCGLSFPDEDMPGIDIVIPDMTYLRQNRSKIRGILVTHGHEDHIGAIPYALAEFDVPVYGTAFTSSQSFFASASVPVTARCTPSPLSAAMRFALCICERPVTETGDMFFSIAS